MPSSKSDTLRNWIRHGLIITSQEEVHDIYDRYINSTHCEKCGKKYKYNHDRHMDHSHLIHDKYGAFRNILCKSCNIKRSKIRSDNTSGFTGISIKIDKTCTQGYYWTYRALIDGKRKDIKTSVDKEWLIDFAKQWKIDNNYNN